MQNGYDTTKDKNAKVLQTIEYRTSAVLKIGLVTINFYKFKFIEICLSELK